MPKKTDRPRIIVIGWDGVPPSLAFEMAKKGELPEVAKLMAEGCAGPLLSTIPPLTAPAWATFFTGKNPGKHGMYDFLAPPRYGYIRGVCDLSYLKATTLWQYLSQQQISVGSLNLPLTFPPDKVNGYMIPGMLTPEWKRQNVFPPTLWDELDKVASGYRIDMDSENYIEGRELAMLSDLSQLTDNFNKALFYLLEKHPVDLFVGIFTGIDRIMHFLWEYMDESHPLHDDKAPVELRHAITDHLKLLDATLGRIRAQMRDQDVLMLLSDHGFGPALRDFDLARFLYEKGYLVFKPGYGPGETGEQTETGRAFDLVKKIDFLGLRKLLPRGLRNKGREAIIKGTSLVNRIDWEKTTVYPGTATQYAVYINTKGREPEGIVEKGKEYNDLRERLTTDLLAIEDETGGKLMDRVILREDAYAGPELPDAPDVYVPLWEKGIRIVEFSDDPLVRPSRRRSGEHRREGILVLAGGGILPGGSLQGARMADIFPTLAYLLGAKIPDDLDGEVLSGIFPNGRMSADPPQFMTATVRDGSEGKRDPLKDEEIKERLKGMGYLS